MDLSNSNPFEVFNHPAFGFVRVVVVDEDDKELFRLDKTSTLNKNNFGVIIINESGLYSLMLRSKLPQTLRKHVDEADKDLFKSVHETVLNFDKEDTLFWRTLTELPKWENGR